MKKTIVNFRNPLYTVLFFALFCLASCQKENIQPTFNKENTELNTNEESVEIHKLDLSNLATQMKSNARNDSWVIANEVVEITNAGPYLMSINVENLPNPNTHRLDVTIIPFDKPTDLVLQSFDPQRNPTNLDLKESRNPGMNTDFMKFRRNDFIIGETNAVLKVEWEGEGNKFELKINAVPVDCEEGRPRMQGDVGIDFQPVCGCDGSTYFDATAAYNAGITSWKRGRCLPNLLIPVDGLWELIDPDFVRHFVRIEDNCIELTIVDIDKNGNQTERNSTACENEETEHTWKEDNPAGYDENGIITIEFKDDTHPVLILPVERWSAQANGQGELEIFKTNGTAKDKDKEDKNDPTTILHRYKRIK